MLFSNAPGRSHLHPIRFHSLVARDFHARGEEKPCCALGRATLVGFYDIYIYIYVYIYIHTFFDQHASFKEDEARSMLHDYDV